MRHRPAEVGLAVKRLQHRHHRALNRALAPLGLSLVQWDTLRHLHENPDASLHDLAVLTFQTDQSFGSLAGRMVDRGLIERLPGPGRAVRHRITEEGARLRAEGQAIADALLTSSFQNLSATELDQLGALLDKALGSDPAGGAAHP
ncbi:MarR family winged helix-turn-helix transcriptional regulator [Kitasatospora sp. NPDC001159]